MINYITFKSILNRKLTSFLCVLSIALSVSLFLGIERIRQGAEEGFTNTISKADLIVGSKGGQLQLLLYTVFHLGEPTNNIRFSSYESIKENPYVKWTIPISLGDSYKGHRVIGTNENFFEFYRYRGDGKIELAEGNNIKGIWDVVIGHEVATKFDFKIGDPISLSHGISKEAILQHKSSPFKIVGILKPTSTPIDKALFISLYGMEAMHVGWESGVPSVEKMKNKADLKKQDLEIKQITAFIVGMKTRIFTLRMRSMIDNYPGEPLMAIIPGMTLNELWKTIGYIEKTLFFVSLLVLIVGIIGIIIALYTSINERRREMAILRSLGAGPFQVFGLLTYESGILVGMGTFLGLGLLYVALFTIRPWLQNNFSIYIPLEAPSMRELLYLVIVLGAGFLAGFLPGLKAYRNSLQDGLTIKV